MAAFLASIAVAVAAASLPLWMKLWLSSLLQLLQMLMLLPSIADASVAAFVDRRHTQTSWLESESKIFCDEPLFAIVLQLHYVSGLYSKNLDILSDVTNCYVEVHPSTEFIETKLAIPIQRSHKVQFQFCGRAQQFE